MKGYDFHPEAEADLESIWEYIAEDSPAAADRMIDEIEATIERLVLFPHTGTPAPILRRGRFRFANAGNYLITYTMDKAPRWVVAIMHGSPAPV